MFIKNHKVRGAIALLLVVGSGFLWYFVYEGWSVIDSAYMVVVTITTVGYEEVRPLSTASRVFNIVFMLAGVGVVLYILTEVVRSFVEEQFIANFLRRRRMEGRLAGLSGHFIICGFGRVGKEVARQLAEEDVEFVVIDTEAERVSQGTDDGHLMVVGDATEDASLYQAGIESAKGLFAAVGNDSNNVFVTLSARRINPGISIVARSTSPETVQKLEIAGADRVVSPFEIAGRRMAMAALRPLAVDVFDSLSVGSGQGRRIAEVVVTGDSPIANRVVRDIISDEGVRVLAIAKKDGDLLVTPPYDTAVELGDAVMLVGPNAQLEKLEGRGK